MHSENVFAKRRSSFPPHPAAWMIPHPPPTAANDTAVFTYEWENPLLGKRISMIKAINACRDPEQVIFSTESSR